MATFQTFEEIEAWQRAWELCREIYAVSNQRAFFKDFSLREQIRKASVPVMSNIAEGFERNGTAEFIQFLAIAKGSTGEVRSQLYVAFDQGYISKGVFDRLKAFNAETSRVIGGLMKYLRATKIKGGNYR